MTGKKSLRRIVLAACLAAALAVPAGASAMFRVDGPVAVSHENGPAVVVRPTSTPSPSIVREIRTVTDNGDQTLPIVLGSLALAIALTGTGYVALRLRPLRRAS